MGTERFIAWVATRHAEDAFRLSMALFGVFVVVAWESMRLWPEKWQRWGRLAFLWCGGIGYASLFAVAVYTLVRAFAGYR
jgi:hypothetical protein